jgi:hypothetical protein
MLLNVSFMELMTQKKCLKNTPRQRDVEPEMDQTSMERRTLRDREGSYEPEWEGGERRRGARGCGVPKKSVSWTSTFVTTTLLQENSRKVSVACEPLEYMGMSGNYQHTA